MNFFIYSFFGFFVAVSPALCSLSSSADGSEGGGAVRTLPYSPASASSRLYIPLAMDVVSLEKHQKIVLENEALRAENALLRHRLNQEQQKVIYFADNRERLQQLIMQKEAQVREQELALENLSMMLQTLRAQMEVQNQTVHALMIAMEALEADAARPAERDIDAQ